MENSKLLQAIQKKDKSVDRNDFKNAVIALFDAMLKGGHVKDMAKQGKLARLRAKILIELRDF